jgi:hypothetical protein
LPEESLDRLLAVVRAARAWSEWRNESQGAGALEGAVEADRLERALDAALASLPVPRDTDDAVGLEFATPGTEAVVPLCAWCKRTRMRAGDWISIEDYLRHAHGLSVSHSLCDTCADEVGRP